MHPLERALVLTVRWLVPGLAASVLLLAVSRPDDPFVLFIGHLSVLVAFGVALAIQLARLVDADDWFRGWPPDRRRLAAAATLAVLDTGAVALVTLASSAAMRFDPSLQFLQLLSTLDIAWAGAAIAIGAYLRWCRLAAWIGGVALGVFCVFYRDPGDEWIGSVHARPNLSEPGCVPPTGTIPSYVDNDHS